VKTRSALIATDLALVSTYTVRFEDAIAFTEMCPRAPMPGSVPPSDARYKQLETSAGPRQAASSAREYGWAS